MTSVSTLTPSNTSAHSTNLIDFYAALEAHDWTYVYSSDHADYLRGQNESIRLSEIANNCPLALALYVAYSAYLFSGKPKPPVPIVPSAQTANRQTKFVRQLNDCLEKMFSDPMISVTAVAHEIAMSERQFFRTIKRILKTTPSEYIRSFRLEKAKALLEVGESVCHVTFESGFSSQSHFGRCFKAKFGVSPGNYKKWKSQLN